MAVQYIFEIQSYSAWIDLVSDDGNPATILQLFTAPDSSVNAHLIYVSFIDPSNGPPSFFGDANGTAPSDYFFYVSAALANEGIATSVIRSVSWTGTKNCRYNYRQRYPVVGLFRSYDPRFLYSYPGRLGPARTRTARETAEENTQAGGFRCLSLKMSC